VSGRGERRDEDCRGDCRKWSSQDLLDTG